MIFSQSGENNGIGFAIPIDRGQGDRRRSSSTASTVDRGVLGVDAARPPTDGDAGAQVAEVEPGSAAADRPASRPAT